MTAKESAEITLKEFFDKSKKTEEIKEEKNVLSLIRKIINKLFY